MKINNDQTITIVLDEQDKRRAEIEAETHLTLLNQTSFSQMEVRDLMAYFFLRGQNRGARLAISQNEWTFGSRTIQDDWRDNDQSDR